MFILHQRGNRFKFTTITEIANSAPKSHQLNIPKGWAIQKRPLAGRVIKNLYKYVCLCV